MKRAWVAIFCLLCMISLTMAQVQPILDSRKEAKAQDISDRLDAIAYSGEPALFLFESDVYRFHFDQKIEGTISPFEVNRRTIHPYAYSYKKVKNNLTTAVKGTQTLSILPQRQLDFILMSEKGQEQDWKQITSAQIGSYQSEDSLDILSMMISVSDLNPTPLTEALDRAGLLAVEDLPVSSLEIKSHSSLIYSGKEINNMESSRNTIVSGSSAAAALSFGESTIGSTAKSLLDERYLQSTNAEFLYNKELTKESDSYQKTAVLITTDSLLNPTYVVSGANSTLDYALRSHSTGVADISYTESMTSISTRPSDMQRPSNEGRERYVGNFDITRKVHMNTSYYEGSSYVEDDWIPCCFGGYLTMPTYYQKGSKGFGSNVKSIFDCTCWRQPGNCADVNLQL